MQNRAQIKQDFLDTLASTKQFIDNNQPLENLHHRFLLEVLQELIKKFNTHAPYLFDSMDDRRIKGYRYGKDIRIIKYYDITRPAHTESWLLLNSQCVVIAPPILGIHNQWHIHKFDQAGNVSERSLINAQNDADAENQWLAICREHEVFKQQDLFVVLSLFEKMEEDLRIQIRDLEGPSNMFYRCMNRVLWFVFTVVIAVVMLSCFGSIGGIGAYFFFMGANIAALELGSLDYFDLWFISNAAFVCLTLPLSTAIFAQLSPVYYISSFLIVLIMIGIDGYSAFLRSKYQKILEDLHQPLDQRKEYTSETSIPPDAYQSFQKDLLGDYSEVELEDKKAIFTISYSSCNRFFNDHRHELIQLGSDTQLAYVLK